MISFFQVDFFFFKYDFTLLHIRDFPKKILHLLGVKMLIGNSDHLDQAYQSHTYSKMGWLGYCPQEGLMSVSLGLSLWDGHTPVMRWRVSGYPGIQVREEFWE